MPTIDIKVIEALRRKQFITEYIVYPQQDSVIDDYQILLSNVPSFSKEDVLVVHNGKLIPHWVEYKGKVWTKVPKLLSRTPMKIFVLTGSPFSNGEGNGTNTFVAFDDFEGAGLLSWTNSAGTWANSGGYRKQTATSAAYFRSYISMTITDYIVHAKMFSPTSLGTFTGIGTNIEKDAGSNFVTGEIYYLDLSQSAILKEGVAHLSPTAMGFTAAPGMWLDVDTLRQENVQKVSIRPEGNPLVWQAQATAASYANKIAGLSSGYAAETWFDNFYVRIYIEKEPIVKKIKTQQKSIAIKDLFLR